MLLGFFSYLQIYKSPLRETPCQAVDDQLQINLMVFYVFCFMSKSLVTLCLSITISNFVFLWCVCVSCDFFYFCLHVCFVLFWFVYLLLFIFICFLKKETKRRHEDGGVRWAGSGRIQGRENHDGKILYKKIKRKKNI